MKALINVVCWVFLWSVQPLEMGAGGEMVSKFNLTLTKSRHIYALLVGILAPLLARFLFSYSSGRGLACFQRPVSFRQ